MSKKRSIQKQTYLFLLIAFIGCKPMIALYDQYAYTQATSLKVDMQNLILESDSTTYEVAKADINSVNTELQKAYEYNKGRSSNSFTTKQYEILLSDTHFYKTFLHNWKTKGTESEALAEDASNKIGDLMDQIIKLENGKNKSK